MNNNDQVILAQQIRDQYVEKKPTELDTLKKLDAEVKRPANAFAYAFGTLSAMVMGTGMSLIMTDVGEMIGLKKTRAAGVVLGIAGMAMAIANYPIHQNILDSRKKKYAPEILALSKRIMGE